MSETVAVLLGSPELRLKILSWKRSFWTASPENFEDVRLTLLCRPTDVGIYVFNVSNDLKENLLSLDFSIDIRSGEKFYADYSRNHPDPGDTAWEEVKGFAGVLFYHAPIRSGMFASDKPGSVTGTILFGNSTIREISVLLAELGRREVYLAVTVNAMAESKAGSLTYEVDERRTTYSWDGRVALTVKEAQLIPYEQTTQQSEPVGLVSERDGKSRDVDNATAIERLTARLSNFGAIIIAILILVLFELWKR